MEDRVRNIKELLYQVNDEVERLAKDDFRFYLKTCSSISELELKVRRAENGANLPAVYVPIYNRALGSLYQMYIEKTSMCFDVPEWLESD